VNTAPDAICVALPKVAKACTVMFVTCRCQHQFHEKKFANVDIALLSQMAKLRAVKQIYKKNFY
jgi:hypothetical protein